jgi:hypothetical protein
MKQRIDMLVPRGELKALDKLAEDVGKTRTDLFLLGVRALAPELLEPTEPQRGEES